MKKNYISDVIKYFFKNDYSVETKEKVQRWLTDDERRDEKDAALYELWEGIDNSIDNTTLERLNKIKTDIGLKEKKIHPDFRSGLLRIAAVLFPLLFLAGGIYFYNSRDNMIMHTAANGEIKEIILPDNSKVWLNSGSKVSYENNFRETERNIQLSGEAFFIVEPDSVRPFIVETGRLRTEVLGTQFNIEDFPDNSRAKATLNTGKIKISVLDNKEPINSYIIDINHQLIYEEDSHGVDILSVQANEITSWREGNLIFDNESLKNIISKLERHFNIRIKVEDIDIYKDKYSVKFVNGEDIEQVMIILKGLSENLKYEIVEK